MSNENYPSLFATDQDWQMNACVNFRHDMSYGYIEGYRRAADFLVEHVAETARDQDFLVYPIAFLYRQHIELKLKQIIDTGSRLLKDETGYPRHHKLDQLWHLAKGILRQTWRDKPDPPEFGMIDSFIKQISKIDCDSTAFRYPTGKTGQPSLQGVQYINLCNLAECVNSFSDFLDGLAIALAEYLQYKYEYEHARECGR